MSESKKINEGKLEKITGGRKEPKDVLPIFLKGGTPFILYGKTYYILKDVNCDFNTREVKCYTYDNEGRRDAAIPINSVLWKLGYLDD